MKPIKKSFTSLILFTLITATAYGHSGAQLSADGQFNALSKPYKETSDIWVKRAARPLTDDMNRPITGFFWRWDDQDRAGDNAASVSAPKPAVDLRPSKSNYQVKIEVGGQAIPFNLTTEIREEGGAWKVIDQATIPMVGEMIDITVLTGIEKVTVPAGNFDAFKCEITPAQGKGGKTTLWVATDDRKVIKVSALVPQMNGAILTSELTQ